MARTHRVSQGAVGAGWDLLPAAARPRSSEKTLGVLLYPAPEGGLPLTAALAAPWSVRLEGEWSTTAMQCHWGWAAPGDSRTDETRGTKGPEHLSVEGQGRQKTQENMKRTHRSHRTWGGHEEDTLDTGGHRTQENMGRYTGHRRTQRAWEDTQDTEDTQDMERTHRTWGGHRRTQNRENRGHGRTKDMFGHSL